MTRIVSVFINKLYIHAHKYFIFIFLLLFFIFFLGGYFLGLIYSRLKHLESKQKEEGHHQTEETHSFGQCESQNSVGEKLLFEGWVTGIANDEGTKDRSNTCS